MPANYVTHRSSHMKSSSSSIMSGTSSSFLKRKKKLLDEQMGFEINGLQLIENLPEEGFHLVHPGNLSNTAKSKSSFTEFSHL